MFLNNIHLLKLILNVFSYNFFIDVADSFDKETLCPQLTTPKYLRFISGYNLKKFLVEMLLIRACVEELT